MGVDICADSTEHYSTIIRTLSDLGYRLDTLNGHFSKIKDFYLFPRKHITVYHQDKIFCLWGHNEEYAINLSKYIC